MKKFELTEECITFLGRKLFRIKALVAFGDVYAGDLGGYVEKEENLSHEGDAWVYGDAKVFDDARVYNNARVFNNARVYNNARVFDDACVYGDAKVYNDARVFDNAEVCGHARVYNNARVFDDACVYGDAEVYNVAEVCNDAEVCGHAEVRNVADYATAKGFGSCCRTTTFFRTKTKGVAVKCGCFLGTLDEFREKVKSTHGESKLAKEYLMLADLMEYKFSEGE